MGVNLLKVKVRRLFLNEHAYFHIFQTLKGKWDDMASLAAARPKMIGILDSFRHTLEDLGGGLGVTDPVSGTVVVELETKKRK